MSLSHQHSHLSSQGQLVQMTYHIVGFDRLNFVSDIANSVPQDESILIRALSFEADGVVANGVLTIQTQQGTQAVRTLSQRFCSVPGLISLRESVEQLD